MTFAIGVDIGGTKIAAGLVTDSGELIKRESEPTPDDSIKIPAIVADLAEHLAGDEKIVGIGIGAAGFTSSDRRTVRFAPNIDWIDEPLADKADAGGILARMIGKACFLGNTTYLALVQMAERKQGARELRLIQPVQEIALILVAVLGFQQLKFALAF